MRLVLGYVFYRWQSYGKKLFRENFSREFLESFPIFFLMHWLLVNVYAG
jgi:hypothetical protein